jgi:ferredoxin
MARSEYVAEINMEDCIHCGEVVQSCQFSARTLNNEEL